MLLLRRLLIVGLLASASGACDGVERYVSGMDDPKYFTWEKGEPAVRPLRASAPGTDHERREQLPGMGHGGDALSEAALQQPKPAAATPPSPAAAATSAQDLRDCQAPDLRATSTDARASAGAITIERSANSPAVADCMVAKGYRKVYRTRSNMY
jgi:hypothetical protein